MTNSNEWQGRTGQAWAEEWQRTDRSFSVLTERLLQRSRDVSFSSALDIGCGAGELALALARGRPQISVVGVDISQQLISAASERASHLANVTFHCDDAQNWRPADDVRPELLISRHGVMFFEDSKAAFANLAALAAVDASLLFSCFRDRSDNPFFTEIEQLLPSSGNGAPDDAPGPFRFADPAKTKAILAESGWRDIHFEPFDCAMIVGAGENPVEEALAYYSSIGPAARALREMSASDLTTFQNSFRDLARQHLSKGIVTLRAGIWLVSARRA